jgi:hypothetical protein
MFRAQQNAFDDVVGEFRNAQLITSALKIQELMIRLNSQGDRREPYFGELGVYHGRLR